MVTRGDGPDPARPPAAGARSGVSEADRLSRPQPPQPIPQRVLTPSPPGLVAYAVLGGRVIR